MSSKCGLAGKYTRAATQLSSPLASRIVKSMAVAQREFPSSVRPVRLASESHFEPPLKVTFYPRPSLVFFPFCTVASRVRLYKSRLHRSLWNACSSFAKLTPLCLYFYGRRCKQASMRLKVSAPGSFEASRRHRRESFVCLSLAFSWHTTEWEDKKNTFLRWWKEG